MHARTNLAEALLDELTHILAKRPCVCQRSRVSMRMPAPREAKVQRRRVREIKLTGKKKVEAF
eukprot:3479849-Prymnesium_polylepis.2